MAFTNRALLVPPGFGTPIQNDTLFLKAGTTIATGAVTTSLAGLTPAIKQGYVRVKLSASSGAGTVARVQIAVTDGTTTEVVFDYNPSVAPSFQSPNQVTLITPFLSELAVTQVNVITNVATAGGTLDIEVAAGN